MGVAFQTSSDQAAQFQIEYEMVNEQAIASRSAHRLPTHSHWGPYFAVGTGGRLENANATVGSRATRSTVPQPLRDAGNRNAPALALRDNVAYVTNRSKVIRHSVGRSRKPSYKSRWGEPSPTGDQITGVDVELGGHSAKWFKTYEACGRGAVRSSSSTAKAFTGED